MRRYLVSLVVLAACPAFAQERPLEESLKADASCDGGDALDVLSANAERSGAEASDLIVAFERIAADPYTCEAVRSGAESLSRTFTIQVAGEDEMSARAAREQLDIILRLAEQQATDLKFEVGPPPRNLTRKGQGER